MWSSVRARRARAAIVASLVGAYSYDGSTKPISSSLPPPAPPGSVVVLRDAGSARKGLALGACLPPDKKEGVVCRARLSWVARVSVCTRAACVRGGTSAPTLMPVYAFHNDFNTKQSSGSHNSGYNTKP